MRHEFLKGLLGKQYVTPMQGILGGMSEGVAALPRGASWGSLIGAMGGGIARGRQSAQMQNYAQMQMMDVQNKFIAAQMAAKRAVADRLWYEDKAKEMGMPGAPMSAVQAEWEHLNKLALKKAGLVPPTMGTAYRAWQAETKAGNTTSTYTEWMRDNKTAGATIIDMTGETAESQARGTARVSREGKIIDAADNARKTMVYTSMARAIVSRPEDVLTEWGQLLGNFAVRVGIPLTEEQLANITTGQQFQGMMGNILAAKLNAATGPQTDNDAIRLKKTLATLGNTPKAKAFLLDASDAISHRAISKERFYEDWMAANDGSSRGAKAAWNKTEGNVPLFGTNPKDNSPLFFYSFRETIRAANKGISDKKVITLWVKKYVNR